MATTQEIADQIVALTSSGKFDEAYELYSPGIVSVEAMAAPGGTREAKGMEAVRAKSDWWAKNHEVHSSKVEGPLIAGDYFTVAYKFDVTFKPESRRFQLDEVAVYKVSDGKIVYEEFFYH